MTQHTQILNILSTKEWVCSQDFQVAFIPEYRSRINELRKGKGHDRKMYNITDEPCLNRCGRNHNRTTRRWKLVTGLLPNTIDFINTDWTRGKKKDEEKAINALF
jgi:hypothetical protein